MESAEQTTTLESRVVLANIHWASFFSKMPLRESKLPSLPYSRQLAIRADGKTATSPVPIDTFEVEPELEG
jgi:hypothetical protein